MRKDSFLDLLGDARRTALLASPGASTRTFGLGDRVERRDDVDEIAIVLEGAVNLVTRDGRQAQVGVVSAGDAIELKALLTSAADWQYNWVTRNAKIAYVPKGFLAELARTDPELFRFVERTACHPELARLERDLRLFKLDAAHIRRVIGAVTSLDVVSRIDLRVDGAHVCVVRSGQVDVESRTPGASDEPLTHYIPGEYFVLGEDEELSFEPMVNTVVWLLAREEWAKIEGADAGAIARFVKFADPMLRALTRRREEETVHEAPPPEKKQPASNKDDGPEISAFAANAETLKALHAKKHPFIQQHDEMDCGAACMAMVSHFFGRRIGVPDFRSLVHVTRDGASLFSLKKAAEHVGMEAIGVKTEYHGLPSYLVPMIALMEYHFVVIYKATQTELIIGDPARGVVTMSAADFKREWSGVVLMLKPTAKLREYPESLPTYGKYLEILRGLRWHMAEALIASLVLFVLGLVPPLFMQFIFDKVVPEQKAALLDAAAMGVLAVTVLANLTEWARNYLLTYIAARADAKFAALFLRRTFELPLSFFAVRRVGAITSRMNELTRIRSFLTDQTLSIIISLISATIFAIILGFYNLILLAIVFLTIPLTLVFIRIGAPRLKQILLEVFKVQSRAQGMAFEHFSSFETIKSINGMVAARWRWEEWFSKGLNLRRDAARLSAFISSTSSVFDGLTGVAILVASVWLFDRGSLSLGQVVATNILVGGITGPISALIGQWESFTQIGVSFARIDDVLTSAPEPTGQKKPKLKGAIEFEDVSFQYGSELSPWALRGVSVSIKPGETVAFVGASGSGKTTLGYMVNLLYPPTRGRVLLDGVEAQSIDLASLREQVAMVTQDNSIFSGTILDTIALGDPNPSFERAMAAAKAADAHDFINRLKNNYASELGEGGSGLSGGQRQRLNIARALYRNPAVLIMDEATASLDAVSEKRVMESIKQGHNRTTILIAHRLNTIMNADRICVFEKGRLVETGSHAELTEAQGAYFRLFRKQLSLAS